MLTVEPRLRTLILYHEDCLEISVRRPSEWEGPDRLVEIMGAVRDKSEFKDHELEITTHFKKATVELLSRAHSPEYIAFVDALSKRVQQAEAATGKDGQTSAVPFTPQVQKCIQGQSDGDLKKAEYSDTTFTTGTLRAARRAAGAVAFAIDRVLAGRNRNAFCIVRPPGHHAGYQGLLDGAKSCGFCIFNSVAVGALHALDIDGHNCPRVAIVDFDVHHGKKIFRVHKVPA
jgi:acetoin utilization deacetylase AcuC-like enzyme